MNETDKVKVDGEKLHLIVHSLLSNAVKFSTEGSIKLKTKIVGKALIIKKVQKYIEGLAIDSAKQFLSRFQQKLVENELESDIDYIHLTIKD